MPSASRAWEFMFPVLVLWSLLTLTHTEKRLLGLGRMSGLGDGVVVLLDRCRLRQVVPTLMETFGYEIRCRMGSSSVNLWSGIGVVVGEGLRGGRGDAMGVFVEMPCDGSSLGVIGSWLDERRVGVLDEMNDVAVVESLACGGGSGNGGSRRVKPKEVGTLEEMGQLSRSLSGSCSWVSAKRRVVADSGTEASTWVREDEGGCIGLTRVLLFG